MVDSHVLQTTPFGRPANVNNSSQGIFLTYRRASEHAPSSVLAVTDICIILRNKGEAPLHTFCMVAKNLNKGFPGSDVFICYKKTLVNAKNISYKPAMLDRYPREDSPDCPLPSTIAMFCLPMGATIECWPAKCQTPSRVVTTFVLTDERGQKYYGAGVNFWETYEQPLTAEQMERLGVTPEERSGSCSDNSSTNDPAEQKTFHNNKCICIVSRYPFFQAFRRYLLFLYRMTVTGGYAAPIERYISHLMYEIPFPTLRRPRVLAQLGNETISFDNPEDSPLPLSGASFIDMLKSLGPENTMYVLLLSLTEHKILLHSLRPHILTSVAESVVSLIFPFHWQCPYIPQCPLDLAGVLHAPLPFVAGVDSRYFEVYEDPPKDVTCIDLDTNTISASDVRRSLKLGLLPKKPAKVLRASLEALCRRIHQEDWTVTIKRHDQHILPTEMDYEFSRRKRKLELEIQEAFLRFMAAILKGYLSFLKPMRSAPKVGSTDTGALFDICGFLRSRDKASHDFYKMLITTQMFIRFIEERSFGDRDPFLVFFDECIEKVDPHSEKADVELVEYGTSLNSDHTVFIAPPEPTTPDNEYRYDRFPSELIPELFQVNSLIKPGDLSCDQTPVSTDLLRKKIDRRLQASSTQSSHFSSPLVVRTRQETRSTLKLLKQLSGDPIMWAKCLLAYAYSIWFQHLPAYVELHASKTKALRVAISILDRMQSAKLPIKDEHCYRILMQLCFKYAQPVLAVKVFSQLKQEGLTPNAITYGLYNRAMLDAKWPSLPRLRAQRHWDSIRHGIRAITILRKLAREKRRQRRTLSVYSGTSIESDYLSQSSADRTSTAAPATQAEGSNEQLASFSKEPNDLGYHSQAATDDSQSFGAVTLGETAPLTGSSDRLRRLCTADLDRFEEFRSRRCLIKRSISSLSSIKSISFDSAAGVLMTGGSLINTAEAFGADGVLRRSVRGLDSVQSRRLVSPQNGSASELARHSAFADISVPSRDSLVETPVARMEEIAAESTPTGRKGSADVASVSSNGLREIPEELEANLSPSHGPAPEPLPSPARGLSPAKVIPVNAGEDPLSSGDSELLVVTTAGGTKAADCHSVSPAKFVVQPEGTLFEHDSDSGSLENVSQTSDEARLMSGHGLDVSGKTANLIYSAGSGVKSLWNRFHTPVSSFVRSKTVDSSLNSSQMLDNSDMPVCGSEASFGSESEVLSGELAPSPSFSALSTQWASRVTSKMVTQLRHNDSVRSLSSKVSSFVTEQMRKGTLESPLKYSISSLTDPLLGHGLMGSAGSDRDRADSDVGSLKEEDASIFPRSPDDLTEWRDDDPAFQLSSGETGTLLSFDLLGRQPFGSQQEVHPLLGPGVEVILCCTMKCPKCSCMLYDDDILAGWAADEQEMNTCCVYCTKKFTPLLTVEIRRTRTALAPPENASHPLKQSSKVPPSPLVRENKAQNSHSNTPNQSPSKVLQSASLDNLNLANAVTSTPTHAGAKHLGGTKSIFRFDGKHARMLIADGGHHKTNSLPRRRRLQLNQHADSNQGGSAENLTTTSTGSQNADPSHPPASLPSPSEAQVCRLTVPFVSPLVLRKQIEYVFDEDGEDCLNKASFLQRHDALYWNLLYCFQRLSVPTHLTQWLLHIHLDQTNDGVPTVVLHHEDPQTLWEGSGAPTPSSPSRLPPLIPPFPPTEAVALRCVYDIPGLSMDEENSRRLMYTLWAAEAESGQQESALLTALIIENRVISRSLIDQIIDHLRMSNLLKPIQLLINEYRKQTRPGCPTLPRHASLYRDLLFLALAAFGRDLHRDAFDREYQKAVEKLPPKIQTLLQPCDRPPSIAVRACSKIFMPMDVY